MTRAAVLTATLGLAACAGDDAPPPPPDDDTPAVPARGETDGERGDPDDPAIWIAPDPAASRILGTDKEHGLFVFDLDGHLVQDLPDGKLNSVDVHTVTMAGRPRTLVVAGDRDDDSVAFYELDPESGMVAPVGSIPAGLTIYGSCVGVDPASGAVWVFFDAKDGTVVQWQLDKVDGALAATELRRFDVGDQVENCVVDGDTLYVGEEDIGVWRFGSSPESGGTGELIAGTDGVELVADVEGMTIYDAGDGAGWLVVSSQGDNAYALYDRRTHAYGGRFRISGGDIDAASESDGIDVTSAALPGYPGGLLVAHDTANEGFTGNFKLVAWDDVTATLGR